MAMEMEHGPSILFQRMQSSSAMLACWVRQPNACRVVPSGDAGKLRMRSPLAASFENSDAGRIAGNHGIETFANRVLALEGGRLLSGESSKDAGCGETWARCSASW